MITNPCVGSQARVERYGREVHLIFSAAAIKRTSAPVADDGFPGDVA
jgi:hypothetical protein